MQQPSNSFGCAIHDSKSSSSGRDHKIHKVSTITPSQNCALDLQYVVGDDICVRDNPLLVALGSESFRQHGAAAVGGFVMESCVGDNQNGSSEWCR